jgi:hypothetical protein
VTEGEAVEVVQRHLESLFPLTCANCGRSYATLREYIRTTRRLGPAVSFDAEEGQWETRSPIGSLALANCPCGSTISLSTRTMALAQRLALLAWMRDETLRRGVAPSDLLERMRDEIRGRALGGAAS